MSSLSHSGGHKAEHTTQNTASTVTTRAVKAQQHGLPLLIDQSARDEIEKLDLSVGV